MKLKIGAMIRRNFSYFLFTAMIASLFLQPACTFDELPESTGPTVEFCDSINATYDGLVVSIIDTHCAIPDCHVSGGDGPGIYTSFASMEPYLTDDLFKEQVITTREMPIGSTLSSEEFDIIQCWVRAGYPEN